MSAANAPSSASLEQLREQALAMLERPNMTYFSYCRRNIEDAYKQRDTDMMEIICWFFSVYVPYIGVFGIKLEGIQKVALRIRRDRGLPKVAHLMRISTFEALDKFFKSIPRLYEEDVINEIFVRPESIPVMVYLVNDRGLTSWKDVKPLLDECMDNQSTALIDGVL